MSRNYYLFTLCLIIILSSFQLKAKSQKRFLFVISAHEYGYFLPELITPLRILSDANVRVDIASPSGNEGHAVATKRLSDKDNQYFKSIGKKIPKPLALVDVDTSLYAGIYVVGGSGPMMDLYNHKHLSRIINELNNKNKIISADCHGPIALAGVKLSNGEFLVKGRKLTAKSNAEESHWANSHYSFLVEDKLTKNGAVYSAAGRGEAYIVIDGNLVTGQNPASAEPLALKLVELLN
ncbi:MAG: hypothetical protein COA86_17365 [Kangiella sp.]|nr:MAG: hypothetical protein COA86_17365 [Kangiella sp.]